MKSITFFNIYSRDGCLGFSDTNDYNNPVCIEQLARYRSVSAACGENFTVVITVKQGDHNSYLNLKKFNDTLY